MRRGRKISGHLYKRSDKKRGAIWWVQWQTNGKKYYQSTGKTNKEDAREAADRIIDPFRAQEEVDTLSTMISRMDKAKTVAQIAVDLANRIPLVEAWRRFPYDHSQPRRAGGTIRELSPGNIQVNKRDWGQFVDWMEENHAEAKAMQDVTPEIAQGYSDHLFKKKRITAGRHNKLITTCNVMYRLAGVPSPFASVTKYQIPEAEHREPFAVQQVEQLLSVATGEMRGLIAVLYFTGLRAGDAVLLKAQNRKDGKIVVRTAKTGATIDILEHPMLTEILGEVCGDARKGLLFPDLAAVYKKDHTALIKLFNRLMKETFGEEFSRTEKRTGRGVLSIARFGMHSFRHSLASHCASAGVPIGIVQNWLGHASATITRIYQHYSTADQEQIVKAIPMLALPGATGDTIEAEAVEAVEHKPVDLATIRKLVKGITTKNLAKRKAKLLEMLSEHSTQTDKERK